MDAKALTDRYLPALEAEMQAVIAAPSSDLHDLYGYLRYHMGWVDAQFHPITGHAGKRLRPTFCLLSCQACGGDWEQALPAAAAIELLHNFSLIHDDIEDGDTARRGRPTLWKLWGLPQGLNAGDALYALAHLALLRLSERNRPDRTVLTAARLFEETCMRLTEGQFLDIAFETQENVSLQTYLLMIEKKTAALLAAACKLGALLAGASSTQQEHLHTFGHHLGLAFQIQDDILGIWGNPQVTGKPARSDLLCRKKTLPIVHALQESAPLRSLFAKDDLTPADIAQATKLIESAGSRAFAEEQARHHTNRALEALDAADLDNPAGNALHDLAVSLLGRTR